MSASILMGGDRRMEAENYLAGGYGIRLALEARKAGWVRFEEVARVWQPNRLKGTLVSQQYGTPFLAATQVFDLRPVPRKFLSLDQIRDPDALFVEVGDILVTRSGNVGRSTLANLPHLNTLISDDLLRVEPRKPASRGWIYAYLRSPQARAMMGAAQYGHVIKHLECSHLDTLPFPVLRDGAMTSFNERVDNLLNLRKKAHLLSLEAEDLFADAIGNVVPDMDAERGFAVGASALFGHRRRLEGSFHTPRATAILKRLSEIGANSLSDVTDGVWWMTRFKRVFGDGGVPYMSADELFSLNPTITKRVLIEQAESPEDYFVKAGWIMMACSGQVYGLNGSVSLMTDRHEKTFFSHDLVRIVPKNGSVRSGYLFIALGHPKFGRPLVIRNAYGTSIPHLDPADIATFPVVRLGNTQEDKIADLAEEAETLRAEADRLECSLSDDAESLIDRFLGGDHTDFVIP